MAKKWGLSFLINTAKTPEGRSPGSLAWAGLANTYFWIDPSRNVTGVILMQLLPFADKQVPGSLRGLRARRLCRARRRQRTEGGVVSGSLPVLLAGRELTEPAATRSNQ